MQTHVNGVTEPHPAQKHLVKPPVTRQYPGNSNLDGEIEDLIPLEFSGNGT